MYPSAAFDSTRFNREVEQFYNHNETINFMVANMCNFIRTYLNVCMYIAENKFGRFIFTCQNFPNFRNIDACEHKTHW